MSYVCLTIYGIYSILEPKFIHLKFFLLHFILQQILFIFYDRKQLKIGWRIYCFPSFWTVPKTDFWLIDLFGNIFGTFLWTAQKKYDLILNLMVLVEYLVRWQSLVVIDPAQTVWLKLEMFQYTMLIFHVRLQLQSVIDRVQLKSMEYQLAKVHFLDLIHQLLKCCSNRLLTLWIKILDWITIILRDFWKHDCRKLPKISPKIMRSTPPYNWHLLQLIFILLALNSMWFTPLLWMKSAKLLKMLVIYTIIYSVNASIETKWTWHFNFQNQTIACAKCLRKIDFDISNICA